ELDVDAVDLRPAQKVVVEGDGVHAAADDPLAQTIGPESDELVGPVAAVHEGSCIALVVQAAEDVSGYGRNMSRLAHVRVRVRRLPGGDQRAVVRRGNG